MRTLLAICTTVVICGGARAETLVFIDKNDPGRRLEDTRTTDSSGRIVRSVRIILSGPRCNATLSSRTLGDAGGVVAMEDECIVKILPAPSGRRVKEVQACEYKRGPGCTFSGIYSKTK